MNENLQAKIAGKLEGMTDEMGRQLLDYLEFLESKYNRSRRAPTTVQRIAENIEDRLGTVRLADVAAKGGAQVMDAAGKLMEGLAAASRVVADELQPPPVQGSGDGQSPEEAAAAETSQEGSEGGPKQE